LFAALTQVGGQRYGHSEGGAETPTGGCLSDEAGFYEQVGARVAAVRRGKRKLTQQALASMVSLSRTSIANIEKGRQKLLLHHFVDIAEALQVDLLELVPPRKHEGLEAMQSSLAELPANRRNWILGAMAQRAKGRK
jgi:transcriptional regulator with XRE-family HTH domain